ncbi:MAG: DUF3829 domain-containing protein [Hyphomicrobium sp.]
MRALSIGLNFRGSHGLLIRVARYAVALVAMLSAQPASANDIDGALQKANVYIETAKITERATESWERYQSWVNLKTGPTGKEPYISYGMYDLYDVERLDMEIRAVAGAKPSASTLDAMMPRYLDAYEALVPVVNRASAYYDSKGYEADAAAEGQALHKQMVPLIAAFMKEREAMMPELRVFVRAIEGQELAAIEARDGRNGAWQVGHVLHAANRVFDLFPRIRPQPMDSEERDRMMQEIGPNTSGEKFEEIMAGVVAPKHVVIDVKRYGEEVENYAKAVGELESYSGEKPEDFDDFKKLPRQLLDKLRAYQGPLIKSSGRPFKGDGQMSGQIVEAYFAMFNEGNGMTGSRLRYLP